KNRGPADALNRSLQLGGRADFGERRRCDPETGDEILLRESILRRRQDCRVRQHRHSRGEKGSGLGGQVFEFVGDNIDVRRKSVQRFSVGVIRAGDAMHDVKGRRIGARRENMTSKTESGGGKRQHAAKLSAAEDADRRLGLEHRRRCGHAMSFGATGTPAVCAARHASSRRASVASLSASTLAASSAAVIAPAWPIASVPTGTPGGICTIEYSESCPDSALDSIGTPNTGRLVSEAVMPGRCAAPPAPAMITLKPSALAPLAKA